MADPAVTAAWIASGAALVGPIVTWAITRRKVDGATVELTDAQAEEIRAKLWGQLNAELRAELARLQGRVADLEARVASLDAALRQASTELAAVQAERDQLRIQIAAAQAELQAKEREIGDLKQALTR